MPTDFRARQSAQSREKASEKKRADLEALKKERQIGRPALRKLIVQARFTPTLDFFPAQSKIAKSLTAGYPDWGVTGTEVQLLNKKKHCNLHISCKTFTFEMDLPTTSEDAYDYVRTVHESYGTELHLNRYERLGVRHFYLVPLDMSYGEIVDVLHKRLLVADPKTNGVFSGKLNDLAYIIDFDKDDLKYHFKAGPVKRTEVSTWAGLSPVHFAPEEYYANASELPEVAILIDIDCYKEELAAEAFLDVFKSCRVSTGQMAVDFSRTVLEE